MQAAVLKCSHVRNFGCCSLSVLERGYLKRTQEVVLPVSLAYNALYAARVPSLNRSLPLFKLFVTLEKKKKKWLVVF